MSQAFDPEEQEILASYERNEWQSTPDLAGELEHYRRYAAATVERSRSVSVSLESDDLERLQQEAHAAGVSRERLIAQIIHQYVASELVERS